VLGRHFLILPSPVEARRYHRLAAQIRLVTFLDPKEFLPRFDFFFVSIRGELEFNVVRPQPSCSAGLECHRKSDTSRYGGITVESLPACAFGVPYRVLLKLVARIALMAHGRKIAEIH